MIEINREEQDKIKMISKNLTNGYGRIYEIMNGIENINNLSNSITEKSDFVLYHYTNADALKSILENETLRLTNAKYLNDSAEINYTLDLIVEVADDIKTNYMASASVIPVKRGYGIVNQFGYFDEKVRLLRNEIERIFDQVYVLSTSFNSDSLMLWSYYAQFEGYNVGIRKEKLINKLLTNEFIFINRYNNTVNKRDCFTYLYNKVIYDKGEQENIITQYLSILLQNFCIPFYNRRENILSETLYGDCCTIDEYIDKHLILSMAIQLGEIAIFFKNPKYYHEEEYRLAIIGLNNNKDIGDYKDVIKYRVCKGVYIPYIEISFCRDNEDRKTCLPIEAINIGPKNNLSIAKDGLISMLGYLNYDNKLLKVDTSKIPLRY